MLTLGDYEENNTILACCTCFDGLLLNVIFALVSPNVYQENYKKNCENYESPIFSKQLSF